MEDGSDLRRIANAAGSGHIEKRRKPYVAHMSGAGSAAMIYLQNNVFDEALERLRMIFDGHDDVIVSMSGGKDSTVLFRMALMVAQERGRLPLKVFWLDQEAEWQATVDYMQHIMELPEVTPYWYQIPFEFTNTLSRRRISSVFGIRRTKRSGFTRSTRSPSRKTPAAKTDSMSLSTSSRPTAPILRIVPCWWECA